MKGITKISTIFCRKNPSDQSELVSQFLYGETYTILEEQEKWVHVQSDSDGYVSWITREQHCPHEVSSDAVPPSVLTHPGELKVNDEYLSSIKLSPGSLIHSNDWESLKIAHKRTLNELFVPIEKVHLPEYSKLFLNTPYLWGGKSIWGIDCSGFMQVLYRCCRVDLPRDAYQQAEIGTLVEFKSRMASDLAFFKNAQGRITHVAMLISKDEVIHASGRVRIDKLTEGGIIQFESGNQSHTFSHLQRIVS